MEAFDNRVLWHVRASNTSFITTHVEQSTVEHIVEKKEIAHNEQLLLLPQYVQLFSKSSAAALLYMGKG